MLINLYTTPATGKSIIAYHIIKMQDNIFIFHISHTAIISQH